jgi:hypothetical protein
MPDALLTSLGSAACPIWHVALRAGVAYIRMWSESRRGFVVDGGLERGSPAPAVVLQVLRRRRWLDHAAASPGCQRSIIAFGGSGCPAGGSRRGCRPAPTRLSPSGLPVTVSASS